jgi:hypothetical protein
VDHGLRRPHSPIALSPPQDPQLDGWQPVAQRDALGLTHDQRASAGPSIEDQLQQIARDMMDRWRKNLELIDSLPADTMIHCDTVHYPGCGPHPVETIR